MSLTDSYFGEWRTRMRKKSGFLSRVMEKAISDEMFGRLRIKAPSDRQIVQYLSGGNQQKVVLGKWLALKDSILKSLTHAKEGKQLDIMKRVYAGTDLLFLQEVRTSAMLGDALAAGGAEPSVESARGEPLRAITRS